MIFHVVVMSEAAAQQAQMFGGGSAPVPPVGPIGPLPSSPSPAGGAEIAQEFRRVCTTANLTVCVPQCNSLTYGFLLSIEIDGRGTVMTCNKLDSLFAWVGQASLGGYIGAIFAAFFSSVISGAAGTYMVTLAEGQGVQTDLMIEPGQVVVINGDRQLPHQPTWGAGGFVVGEFASLSLSYLQIDTVIRTDEGSTQLTVDECMLTTVGTALMLRAARATFINYPVFQGCIEIPADASVTITDSTLSFDATISTAVFLRSGAALTATSVMFRVVDDAAVVVSVDDGGSLTAAASQLVSANFDVPLPCRGTHAQCTEPQEGVIEANGPLGISTTAPLVCDAVTGECHNNFCLIANYCGEHATACTDLHCVCEQHGTVLHDDKLYAGPWRVIVAKRHQTLQDMSAVQQRAMIARVVVAAAAAARNRFATHHAETAVQILILVVSNPYYRNLVRPFFKNVSPVFFKTDATTAAPVDVSVTVMRVSGGHSESERWQNRIKIGDGLVDFSSSGHNTNSLQLLSLSHAHTRT
eukprot:SAG22_NODE_24_length_30194_cov_6.086327_8_plen_525_part_00